MDTNTEQQPPSGELAALAPHAAALDVEIKAELNPAPAAPQGAAPILDEASELAGMLELAGAMVGPFMPRTGAALKGQAIPMGAGMSAVFQKYGWSTQGFLDKWGPEIALVVASFPVVMAARADLAERREAQEKNEKEPAQHAQQAPQETQPA